MPGQAMTGGGYYNAHSEHQRRVTEAGMALLERAATEVGHDVSRRRAPGSTMPPGEHLVIADYGSSEGANSVEPMRMAIETFRATPGHERWPATVVHLDLPENDWCSLFELAGDPEHSYHTGGDQVFTLAAGRSFYGTALPPASTTLGWSSTALHWVVDADCPLEYHLFPVLAEGVDGERWSAAAADLWERFLARRQDELISGGQLVMVIPTASPCHASFLHLFEDCIVASVSDGVIDASEAAAMVIPFYHRSHESLMQPFSRPSCEFEVREEEECIIDDPAYTAFRRHRDAEQFGVQAADAVRAWSEPSLAAGLSPERSSEEHRAALDAVYVKLEQMLAARPDAGRFDWQMALLRLRRR